MTRKTYSILDPDNPELVFEEVYNEKGQISSFKDLQAKPIYETHMGYNEIGLITSELEIQDDIEVNKQLFKYDENENLIEFQHFIGEYLFETISTKFSGESFHRITMRDGEQVEKVVKTCSNEDDYILEFYALELLIEKQINTYNEKTNVARLDYYDAEGNLNGYELSTFDENDILTEFSVFDEAENLLEECKYVLKDGFVSSFIERDFRDGSEEFETKNTWDNLENITLIEKFTLEGKLVGFDKSVFDSENRLIEEVGHSSGNFDAIYGTYSPHAQYHYKHEYST